MYRRGRRPRRPVRDLLRLSERDVGDAVPYGGFSKGITTMEIRTATMADLPAVTRLEAICFPAAEAASEVSDAAVFCIE